jgi:hypothetical protein
MRYLRCPCTIVCPPSDKWGGMVTPTAWEIDPQHGAVEGLEKVEVLLVPHDAVVVGCVAVQNELTTRELHDTTSAGSASGENLIPEAGHDA